MAVPGRRFSFLAPHPLCALLQYLRQHVAVFFYLIFCYKSKTTLHVACGLHGYGMHNIVRNQ